MAEARQIRKTREALLGGDKIGWQVFVPKLQDVARMKLFNLSDRGGKLASCSIYFAFVCTTGLRRRRREVLEEEEDMDEEDFQQLAAQHDADLLPGDHCLPEDTTGTQFGVLRCRLVSLFFSWLAIAFSGVSTCSRCCSCSGVAALCFQFPCNRIVCHLSC